MPQPVLLTIAVLIIAATAITLSVVGVPTWARYVGVFLSMILTIPPYVYMALRTKARQPTEESPPTDLAAALDLAYSANFAQWQKTRRTLTRIGLALPFMAIGGGYFFASVVMSMVAEGVTASNVVGAVTALAAYVYWAVGWPLSTRRALRRSSAGACIHAVRQVSLHLQDGDLVTASWYMERLLAALAEMVKDKSLTVGNKRVSPRSIMAIRPESIQKRAVYRAVQGSESGQEFLSMLRTLESGLPEVVVPTRRLDHAAISTFLTQLYRKTEPYHTGTLTLFDKYPTLVAVVRVAGPIALSGLAAWLANL